MDDLMAKMDTFIEEVRANPDQRKRLLSKTFWGQLKIQRRTDQRIMFVENYLADRGIKVSAKRKDFGKEPKEDWLTLQHWHIAYPNDDWFEQMASRVFENEREVHVFFLTPLFKALGYQVEDFTFEYKVDIAQRLLGMLPRGQRNKFVDLALFDGADRADPKLLVVCEAKTPETPNSRPRLKNLNNSEKCLKVYRIACSTSRRFMATNGDIVKIFTAGRVDIVPHFEVHRSEFKEHWQALYLSLGKPILVGELDS